QSNEPVSSAVSGHLRIVAGGRDPRLASGRIIPRSTWLLVAGDRPRLGDDDVVIEGDRGSGLHAQMSCDAAPSWVEDLGSTNGTYIDSRRLSPHERTEVPPGSTLQFGDATFTLMA